MRAEPTPLPLSAPASRHRVPLRRTARATGHADFTAAWALTGVPFTGTLRLSVRSQQDERGYVWPISFIEGRCETLLELPVGEFQARLMCDEGSSLHWRRPMDGRSVRFNIVADRTTTAGFELWGGRLVLQPQTADGVTLREFGYSLGGTLDTWRTTQDFIRERGGIVLFHRGGKVRVTVRKFGFAEVEGELLVPSDGTSAEWAPTLLADEG